MSIVEIKKIAKHFGGVWALDDVSITFERGTITGIIGPNGSGKSTLVNALTGMVPFDRGTIVVGGVTLKRICSADVPAYGMTRTFQEIRLFEQMSVLDNILVVLTERSLLGSLFERHSVLHEKKAEEALSIVGLWEKRAQYAATLSYGQRKLLEIARVLAMEDTDIIFFDEPFAGLFPEMVTHVQNIIEELKRSGKTIILIEHDMDIIRSLTDSVVVLDGGEVLAQGQPANVLKRKEVIEAYLGT